MKKFFVIFYSIVILFFSLFCYYYFEIYNNIYYGLGNFNQVPNLYNVLLPQDTLSLQHSHVLNIECKRPTSKSAFFTLGDSFSNFSRIAYQPFLSELSHSTIYNIERSDQAGISPVQSYVNLLRDHFFQAGDTVVLESTQAANIGRLNFANFNGYGGSEWTKLLMLSKRRDPNLFLKKRTFHMLHMVERIDVTTQKVFSMFFSWMRLSLGYKNPIVHFKTKCKISNLKGYSHDLFVYDPMIKDRKIPNKLLHDGELEFLNYDTIDYIQARKKIDEIYAESVKQGIHFFFLVPTTKYDLYYDYLVLNRYPKDPTLSYFEDLEGSYYINTKKILLPLVQKGVLDVYGAADTHWSNIGTEIVAQEVYNRIYKP